MLATAAVVAMGCGGGAGDNKAVEEARAAARAGAESLAEGTKALDAGLKDSGEAGAAAVGAMSDVVKDAAADVASEASSTVDQAANLVAEGAEAVTGTSREALDDARAAVAGTGATSYEVIEGDTLGSIASRHYQDASQYQRIAEANSGTIEDPHLIYPGQVLRLPRGR